MCDHLQGSSHQKNCSANKCILNDLIVARLKPDIKSRGRRQLVVYADGGTAYGNRRPQSGISLSSPPVERSQGRSRWKKRRDMNDVITTVRLGLLLMLRVRVTKRSSDLLARCSG